MINRCQQESVVHVFLDRNPPFWLISAQREDTVGRLVTERSKEVAAATSGVGLPSASGCKDPMYQDILSLHLLLNYVQEHFLCLIGLSNS